MTKRMTTALFCCLLSLFLIIAAGICTGNNFSAKLPAGSSQEINTYSESEIYYVLKAYNGQIGVFAPDNSEIPQILTGIRLSGLRKTDRIKLEEGIHVLGYDNVLMLLEDFGS